MTTKEEVECQSLVTKRERWYSKLQVTYDFIAGLPEREDTFLARVQNIEADFDKFNDIQDRLINLKIVLKKDISINQVSKAYEELYYHIRAKADTLLKKKNDEARASLATVESISHELRTVRPKLPPITIPKFKGDLEKFRAFRSLYDTLVHDTNLPAIQKFAFLKSYLEYPASSVLDHFDITAENYEAAYDKLIKRYTDKRLVGTYFLNKLLQFKPLPNGNLQSLRQFIDIFCVQYTSLKSLDIPDLTDFIIFNLALKVLDTDTKRLFEDKFTDKAFPTFEELSEFIVDQLKVVTLLQPSGSKVNTPNKIESKFIKPSISNNISHSTTKLFLSNTKIGKSSNSPSNSGKISCPVCGADHKIYVCSEFSTLSHYDRLAKIKSLKLCFSCFGKHHQSQCGSKMGCRHCRSTSHHSLLHNDNNKKGNDNSIKAQVSNISSDLNIPETTTQVLSCRTHTPNICSHTTTGLLSTALAHILDNQGEWISCRLVIDPASESSFISESLVQKLGLKRRYYPVDIVGIGSSTFKNHKGVVSIRVTPCHVNKPILEIDAIILSKITSDLPRSPLPQEIRNKFSNLNLADPTFDKPNRVDILLGVQHYAEILSNPAVVIPGEPAALNSIFGYLIFGKVPVISTSNSSLSFLTHTPSLEYLLQKFWESEECMDPSPQSYNTNTDCESHFLKTFTRDNSGRYQISLPFKQSIQLTDLGSTRHVANKRLLSLERKLSKDPDYKTQYHDNLRDYVTQDHIGLAPHSSEYLLTHHAVIKDSTTTNVRVVFNGSEKSTQGHSLNDFLLVGPKLQTDISLILLHFRLHPVTLISDIKQMFRCIRLNDYDKQFVHFLWREDYELPILEWEFKTLPFGLTCSPFLAQRVLHQLVADEGTAFPLASKVLLSHLYVDDLIISIPSESEAIVLFQEVTDLLKLGGFELRKFSSNNSNLFSMIPKEHRENPSSFEESSYIKLLGLIWDPVSDKFTYKTTSLPLVPTKRGVLSQVARIYDIQGFISPVTFWIKSFIQRLWIDKLGWDDTLPKELLTTWTTFSEQLSDISKIHIDRYLSRDSDSHLLVVGFSDASEKGYGACLYLIVKSHSNDTNVFLLKAKSKVAPIKPLTIPRMELNAAVLLLQLIDSVQPFLISLHSYELLCCTDSTVVISWLNTPLHELKSYIAHRVVRITDTIKPSVWWHVPGRMNPADLASRGLFPRDIISNSLWWNGPDFFKLPVVDWPLEQKFHSEPLPDVTSGSKVPITDCYVQQKQYCLIEDLLYRYSSLTRVKRILAWVFRFSNNLRKIAPSRSLGFISTIELQESLDMLVRWTQTHYYADLLKDLKKDRPLKGSLRLLTPFLDPSGLIRVGGRLTLSSLPYNTRHPLLLPRISILAKLICSNAHNYTLHGGIQLMQSFIYKKFWIPGIRYLLRDILFHCVTCYRYKAKTLEPLMGDLPELRFNKTSAFINTGVDLAGPYLMKETKRRNATTTKCWVVLFLCMTTRAIHLDIVSDLSSISFLAAFDRFIYRRGLPSIMCSDLGTNFVGSARELREIRAALKRETEAIDSYCTDHQITWRFNPPAAPNFGGGWEAGVKSMKYHLRRIIGQRPLTQDEFLTLLIRIEGILNSRPICPLSSSPSDGFDVLTPGHFLIGRPIVGRPEINYEDRKIDFRSRWELLARSIQDLWKRWSKEYLHTLMQRSKWNSKNDTVKIDQLVLLVEKSTSPTHWVVGRILEILPGQDGVIRVVRVKTPYGTFVRPVNKLAALPIS